MSLSPIIRSNDLPAVNGAYIEDADLSKYTWFRVGGKADVLYLPKDEADLQTFLTQIDADLPVQVIGVGSNLLVRDGGIRGVVIRLGPGFAKINIDGLVVEAGAAALDANVAKKAGAAGVGGLSFLRGIPGTIGGALTMNAGAYGGETKDYLIRARGIDRSGKLHEFTNAEMHFEYRKSNPETDVIWTGCTFKGVQGDPDILAAQMAEIMAKREASQPIKDRTGGSTFKNPDPTISNGRGSWQMVDAVGGRGRIKGGAQFSELHCNFLINMGDATAADLEDLGDEIRAEILAQEGVEMHWEIKRIGERLDG